MAFAIKARYSQNLESGEKSDVFQQLREIRDDHQLRKRKENYRDVDAVDVIQEKTWE